MNRLKVMELIKSICFVVLAVVLGILIIVLKDNSSFLTILKILNYAMLALGVYMIVYYLVNIKTISSASSLIVGAMLVLYAVILLITDLDLLFYSFGLLIACVGAYYLGSAIEGIKNKNKCWLKDLIFSILLIIFGILFYIILVHSTLETLFVIMGITLITLGVYKAVALFVFKKSK